MNRSVFLLLFLFLLGVSLVGQSIREGGEAGFAFKVKQIDEFIDRFNHAPHTLALREDPRLTHRENLYSLFNQESEHVDFGLAKKFVKEVLARSGKKILDFYDARWYAELECSFLYRGVPQNITLILQSQLARNGGSKWVIVSVLESMKEIVCEDIPKAKNASYYLHPMSHATNFMELERAFEDKENLDNLFDPWNQGMDFLAFKHGLLNGTLKYQHHHRVTYHFLQLDRWIFTVDYFPGKGYNAGWLISNLASVTQEEKLQYKSDKLNLL